ncbi:hypothetical protein NL676_000899 [Syzygium grande]|nr:hypothetical protein NL676_000899 [Syzygium grande]
MGSGQAAVARPLASIGPGPGYGGDVPRRSSDIRSGQKKFTAKTVRNSTDESGAKAKAAPLFPFFQRFVGHFETAPERVIRRIRAHLSPGHIRR